VTGIIGEKPVHVNEFLILFFGAQPIICRVQRFSLRTNFVCNVFPLLKDIPLFIFRLTIYLMVVGTKLKISYGTLIA